MKITATLNKRGFTYASLTRIGKAFIEHAANCKEPVMDIGCAYGVMTLPLLERGADVIAVDCSDEHISRLLELTPNSLKFRLHPVLGRLPYVTDIPDNMIGAIYISHVLPFLKPDEIEMSVKQLYNWLVKGGKVYIVSFTPFTKLFAAYLPVYHSRKKAGIPYAGYIENLPDYSADLEFSKQLPNQLNHMDVDDFEAIFKKCGFKIEELGYFDDSESSIPDILKYDGRERIGLIASKI